MSARSPLLIALAVPLALSACAPTQTDVRSTAPAPVTASYDRTAGVLMGMTATRLTALFGEPRLDIRDRTVRKMQFDTGRCIIDTYLYTEKRGQEPTTRHVDARTPDGTDTELSACGVRVN